MNAPEKLGKYELRGMLGRGAMGIVYDGWDPLIDRRVAIKTVRLVDADDEETAEALARFRRGAQAAGRLQHPNIVAVYDYGEVDDIAFIVMEFAAGTPLKTVLDEQKRLPPRDAVRIMEQVLAGLAYSHARGVVHRDIKPGNIMIVEGGQVKIADFGIARIESSSMTSVGTMMGTPAYMPPEQFLGEPVDARSDLYAAGVMAFQLLSGRRPYEGSLTTIMQKVLNTERPPAVSAGGEVPAAFDAVVARAMARVPADRFASAEDFADALRAALAQAERGSVAALLEETVVVNPNRAPKPAQPALPAKPPNQTEGKQANRVGMMRLVLDGVALLAVAGAGGAYLFLRGASVPPPPPPQPPPTHNQSKFDDTSVHRVIPAQSNSNGIASQVTTRTVPVQPPSPPAKPPPPPDPEMVSRAVAAAAAAAPCSFLTTTVAPDGVWVNGFDGSGDPDSAARAAVNAAASGLRVAWQARALDPFWCPILDVLRPYGAAGAMEVRLATGARALRDGELIKPDVQGPGFASWMRVDDFARGGEQQQGTPIGPNVVHFYPTAKPRAHKLVAGALLQVRDKNWCVGAPFGTDLIVAVATANPLFPGMRATQEDFDTYLSALRTALASAAQHGDDIAVGIATLETEPGKGGNCNPGPGALLK
jgi:serine/threonine-protein kinase